MKEKGFRGEIATSLILIAILVLFIRPTNLLMPSTVEMMLPVLLVVAFLTFSSLFWKEKAQDEREANHITKAGRISFFTGSIILTVGVVVQSLRHNVDPWLVYSLVGMVLAKVASRIYSQIKN